MAGVAESPITGSALRDQIVAEMSGAAPVETAPAEDAPVVEAANDNEPAEAAEPEVEAASDDEPEVETDEDEDADEAPADPETAKRLDTVRRAEKRMRAQLESERAQFDLERQRHADRVAKLDEFEGLARRAKYDPGAVMRALGLGEDDFAVIAQALYAESKEGAADPQRKAQAARLLQERERNDKLTAIERRAIELEQKLERQQQEAAAQAEAARYFERMSQAATAKHPLVAHMLKADPDETAQGLVAAYERLSAKGKVPDAAKVVAEFDRAQRARLQRLGIDPDGIAKPKAAAAVKSGAKPAVAVRKPANENAAPTRDQLIAELESGTFD